MGLDLSCNVSFSYGGFSTFRKLLAKEININLDEMQGFGGDISFDTITDNIKFLLNHSDCDGYLTPEECNKIAPRLKELTKTWSESKSKVWYRQQAIYLAEGMEDCYKNNKCLNFY